MLSRLKGIETPEPLFIRTQRLNTLDMLSRLKGIETCDWLVPEKEAVFFGYAFPFEGNWNPFWIAVTSLARFLPLDMLSRLKGIETHINAVYVLSSSVISFGYAFPFEGNWNLDGK